MNHAFIWKCMCLYSIMCLNCVMSSENVYLIEMSWICFTVKTSIHIRYLGLICCYYPKTIKPNVIQISFHDQCTMAALPLFEHFFQACGFNQAYVLYWNHFIWYTVKTSIHICAMGMINCHNPSVRSMDYPCDR